MSYKKHSGGVWRRSNRVMAAALRLAARNIGGRDLLAPADTAGGGAGPALAKAAPQRRYRLRTLINLIDRLI
jgi:hypothetical protein